MPLTSNHLSDEFQARQPDCPHLPARITEKLANCEWLAFSFHKAIARIDPLASQAKAPLRSPGHKQYANFTEHS